MFLRIAGFRYQRLIIRSRRDERTKVIYIRDVSRRNFNFETRQLIIFRGFRERQASNLGF